MIFNNLNMLSKKPLFISEIKWNIYISYLYIVIIHTVLFVCDKLISKHNDEL